MKQSEARQEIIKLYVKESLDRRGNPEYAIMFYNKFIK